jgi:hypothetical protein
MKFEITKDHDEGRWVLTMGNREIDSKSLGYLLQRVKKAVLTEAKTTEQGES